jgi:rhodanese-related sulfurtransferase
MSSQRQRKGFDRAGVPGAGGKGGVPMGGGRKPRTGTRTRAVPSRTIAAVIGVLVIAVVAIGGWVLLSRGGGTSSTGGAGSVVQTSYGSYTNITADTLASELKTHDFTLLNVKTPYIGEIDGTDLYIPYTEIASRASDLPADKSAKLVVYCRSGAESAIAVQTLLQMGYTNVQNLDGGMNAWTASGRSLVQKNRT